jgi:hypothetical protein
MSESVVAGMVRDRTGRMVDTALLLRVSMTGTRPPWAPLERALGAARTWVQVCAIHQGAGNHGAR